MSIFIRSNIPQEIRPPVYHVRYCFQILTDFCCLSAPLQIFESLALRITRSHKKAKYCLHKMMLISVSGESLTNGQKLGSDPHCPAILTILWDAVILACPCFILKVKLPLLASVKIFSQVV